MTSERLDRKSYSDEFKRKVARAAMEDGATLSAVGKQFVVNPTLVRNWKLKFSQTEEAPMSNSESRQKLNFDDYYEVVITDESGDEWFYWVECDDEDDAVEAAVEKHDELGRPEAVDDFDEGVFPMAYQPVIKDNEGVAYLLNRK